MKKLIGITGAILIACVCVSSIFAPPVNADTEVLTSQSMAQTQCYVIRSEQNRIVVYRLGEAQPYITTDTFVSSLPKSDALALENGIEVDSEQKLRKILEDYCS